MYRARLPSIALLAALSLIPPHAAGSDAGVIETNVLTEFDTPLLDPATAQHLLYANPDAPKGGSVTLAGYGTFDSLNSLIVQGEYPRGLSTMISDPLMVRAGDQIGVFYPLIVERLRYDADVTWAELIMNPAARWHDGTTITAGDVAFTFDAVRRCGRPFLQSFLRPVASLTATDDHTVRLTFVDGQGSVKALSAAVQIIAPEPAHWWQQDGRDICKGTAEPPLGSGPYRVDTVDMGRSISYARVPDYWARDQWVNRGLNNFDHIRFDYYQDFDILYEAMRGDKLDLMLVYSSRQWASAYPDHPAVLRGDLLTRMVPNGAPGGMQGFYLNTRKPQLTDARVRQALGLLYDFTWTNRNIMYDSYTRNRSFFRNTPYTALGVPEGEELAVLEPFRDQLPAALFSEPVPVEDGDGSGLNRQLLRQALRLFAEAGWTLTDGTLVNSETGAPFALEIMIRSPAMERVTQPWLRNLERAGINASIRMIGDTANYQRRLETFDYDVTVVNATFYPPAGPELLTRFSTASRDEVGSGNWSGIADPVIDALLTQLIAADGYEAGIPIARALDRVLMWGHYVIPHWYNPNHWVAHWDRFGYPDTSPHYGHGGQGTIIGTAVGFPATWWWTGD